MNYLENIQQWLATLQPSPPQSVLDILDVIYSNALVLLERYRNLLDDISFADAVASVNFQTVLPPLITVLTVYFAIVSLYRTTTFFIRATLFLVKWGAFFGFLVIGVGILFKVAMPEAYNDLTIGQMGYRSTHRPRRPRIWDNFEAHRKWRDTQAVNSFPGPDVAKTTQEIVDKIVDTARQAGVLNRIFRTLSGFTAKSVLGSESLRKQDTSKGITRGSRGKAKVR